MRCFIVMCLSSSNLNHTPLLARLWTQRHHSRVATRSAPQKIARYIRDFSGALRHHDHRTRSQHPGKTRKQNASQSDRQHQRKWIQLIEAWQPSSSSSESFGIVSRDELVEEISHHAQVLCRTIKDRSLALDAFRMAIRCCPLSRHRRRHTEDAAGLSRIEQLGQQLLQLAIHSVAAPSLNSLKAQNADSDRVQQVAETIEELEQLSRRLSMYERQRSLAQKQALPTLPVSLVLEEPSSTTLLFMASLRAERSW